MRLSFRPLLFVLGAVAIVGCKPGISLKDLREKNRITIDAAVKSYAAMEQAISTSSQPVLNGPCSHPGLVPVIPMEFSGPAPVEHRFGPAGDPNTELLDSAYLAKSESVPTPNGLFKSDGPLNRVVSDARYAKTPLDFKVDPKTAQVPYDAASKVRYALVARVDRRGPGAPADRVDVFLFEHPKASLVCSFSLDASADRKLTQDNGYDPHTGEPKKIAFDPKADDLQRLFMDALEDRFGITYPPSERRERRLGDDPKVTARASAVSSALDATPDALPECSAADATGGVRLNKKALRILSGGPLLGRLDPNVRIDPNNSVLVVSYLRSRDRASAGSLESADKWKVVDIQFGGPAASLDNKTFVGGSATGREVVFDAANRAVCQTRLRLAPPKVLEAKTRSSQNGWSLNDLSERSGTDLRRRIDDTLGAP